MSLKITNKVNEVINKAQKVDFMSPISSVIKSNEKGFFLFYLSNINIRRD